MILHYRYRVKSLTGLLNKQARAVNFVFNFCNDTQKHALKWGRQWPSGYDLMKLTTGSSRELGLNSNSINQVCAQYARSRQQHKRPYLRYRGKRSLGWIPVRAQNIRETANGFHFNGREYRVFKSRPLPPESKIKDGTSFSRDARGNWYLNVCVEVADAPARNVERAVGIDLGLKEFAALSSGEIVGNPRHFRQLQDALGKAQRARKKRQAAHIHARIGYARQDFLHKLSTRIVAEFDYIAVGNVSASKLAKTKMAKSVNDASWSSFRSMLAYKSITNGVKYEEVNESMTSQTCSSCGSTPPERPRGIAGLGIREWACSGCGTVHDRDVNAARNILARGLASLAEGAVHV